MVTKNLGLSHQAEEIEKAKKEGSKATESTEGAPDWAGLLADQRTPLVEYRITPSPPAATNVP